MLVISALVGAAAFYGGIKYAENANSRANFSVRGGQNFSNLSPEKRQERIQQMGGAGIQGGRFSRSGGDFANGEILEKDEKSITLKLRDGGSKIIFYSDSAEIGKFVNGTSADLEVGKIVTVNGKANQDGSITAQSIQIRPDGLNLPRP